MCKNNLDYFLSRAYDAHGDRYDYSLVEYKNANTKIKIICREHGVFEQLPAGHVKGYNCKKCGNKARATTITKNTKSFVEKAIEVHKGMYDYSKSEYKNTKSKIEIICKNHGSFFQTAKSHLQGAGCSKCNNEKRAISKTTTDSFIERVKKIHCDLYSYEKTSYKKNSIKVTITCKIHGDFEQTPSSHLIGKGCLKCAKEIGTFKKEDYIKIAKGRKAVLYLLLFSDENEEFYKIGKTLRGLKKRFAGYKYKYKEIYLCEDDAEHIFDLEIFMHKKYKAYKYEPLSYFPGYTECYNMDLPVEDVIKDGEKKIADQELYENYKKQFLEANKQLN